MCLELGIESKVIRHIRKFNRVVHTSLTMLVSIIQEIFYPKSGLFDFLLKFLFLVGLWPEEQFSSKYYAYLYKIYEITLHFGSLIYLVITGIGTYMNKNDLIIVLTNLDKTLVGYNFFLKGLLFTWKRKQIRILINEIINSGDHVTFERKKLMNVHAVVISALTTIIAGVFCSVSIIKKEQTVEAWMPFEPLKNLHNQILAMQIIVVTYCPCSVRANAMQGIVCGILIYLCDQLVEIQERIKNLKYTLETEQSVREEFNEIVRKHIRIMGYGHAMKEAFKEYFFVQNLAITLELCLNAIMVSIVGFEQKAAVSTFIAFLVVALLNAYIYCYLGHELILQSSGIALAAYEAEWTNWPVDMQKKLLTVIRVAQKPLQLTAGGIATMSIQTYSQALYNGYSIFAVLNDIVD